MKEFNYNELIRLDRISKINIFVKILTVNEFKYDKLTHSDRISKINIFVIILISERDQLR